MRATIAPNDGRNVFCPFLLFDEGTDNGYRAAKGIDHAGPALLEILQCTGRPGRFVDVAVFIAREGKAGRAPVVIVKREGIRNPVDVLTMGEETGLHSGEGLRVSVGNAVDAAVNAFDPDIAD